MSFGFGLRAFKKYPELIPLCSIIGTACVGACGFMGYALATKPDVRVNKRDDTPPWEKVGPTEKRKMVIMSRDRYEIDPEIQKLRKEIGSYKL